MATRLHFRMAMMKGALIVALIHSVIAFGQSQNPSDSLRKPPTAYELYSWKATGGWNFCVLPSPSVNVQASAIFDRRCRLRGVTALETRLSKLPAGTTIYWLDRTLGNSPKTNENERLGYPPEMIIRQVRDDAEKHHLEVQLLRGNQKK